MVCESVGICRPKQTSDMLVGWIRSSAGVNWRFPSVVIVEIEIIRLLTVWSQSSLRRVYILGTCNSGGSCHLQ